MYTLMNELNIIMKDNALALSDLVVEMEASKKVRYLVISSNYLDADQNSRRKIL